MANRSFAMAPGWIARLRGIKERAVAALPTGDMPPVLFARKNGAIVLTAIAPQVDRDLALRAAAAIRAGLEPESLIVAFDTFGREEAGSRQEGEFQRDFEAGGPAADRIAQAVVALQVDAAGSVEGWRLEYVHRAGVVPFAWGPVEGPPAVAMSGPVPRILADIMTDASGRAARDIALMRTVAAGLGVDPREETWRRARGCVGALKSVGFGCEYVEGEGGPGR